MLYYKSFVDHNSVIFYLHLPKSGGTSVRLNLSKFFNENQIIRLYEPSINHFVGKQTNDFLKKSKKNFIIEKKIKIKNYIKKLFQKKKSQLNRWGENENILLRDFDSLKNNEKQNLKLIITSTERMTDPSILGKHFLKILTIRDPISRLQSYYFEAKNKNLTKPYQIIASKYDINDFIKYLYNEKPYMVSNPYCVCLTGTQDFLIAKKKIDTEFFLAAPIEQLNNFLELIRMKFCFEKKEFTRYRVSKLNPERTIISDKLLDKIISTNKADIDLKKHIEIEFKKILDNY